MADFINENIFKKIDILEYEWENYGEYCPGATGLYMKHIDFHKIGQLLLNNGKYNNEQIISEDWINEMCKLQLELLLHINQTEYFLKWESDIMYLFHGMDIFLETGQMVST